MLSIREIIEKCPKFESFTRNEGTNSEGRSRVQKDVAVFVKDVAVFTAMSGCGVARRAWEPPPLPSSTKVTRGKERGSGYKDTWKRECKLPWREAGPPNHQDGPMDSDQWVVNK